VASAVTFLLAFGLFVTYGMFRVVNMAHGDMVMLGAYVASALQSAGSGFVIAVIGAAMAVAGTALVMERICIGRLRTRSALATLLATWGFGLVLSQSVRLISGSGGRFVDPPVSGQIEILGAPFSSYQVLLMGIALTLLALTWYLLARTGIGTRIRACIGNRRLAELHGINTSLLFTVTFAAGGAFAGTAGALLAPISAINPDIGSGFSISSFMVLITGGLGSVGSTALGSLVVGGGNSVIGAFTTATAAKFVLLAVVAVILVIRRRDQDFD
jgi:branched-subunit amino acid ABC-type transport system permease component